MSALGDDGATFENDDQIRMTNRREAMCNGKGRAVLISTHIEDTPDYFGKIHSN